MQRVDYFNGGRRQFKSTREFKSLTDEQRLHCVVRTTGAATVGKVVLNEIDGMWMYVENDSIYKLCNVSNLGEAPDYEYSYSTKGDDNKYIPSCYTGLNRWSDNKDFHIYSGSLKSHLEKLIKKTCNKVNELYENEEGGVQFEFKLNCQLSILAKLKETFAKIK